MDIVFKTVISVNYSTNLVSKHPTRFLQFFASELTYMNVDQEYLDKQCRTKDTFLLCKQTQPIHDRRSKHDCAAKIMSIDNTIKLCQFSVYKIEEITFIPLQTENQYIAIPAKPMKSTVFKNKEHEFVKLKQTPLLRSDTKCDILYGNNHMNIGGNSINITYEIKIKTIPIGNDTNLDLLLNILENTPKIFSNINSYFDTLDQITDKTDQLQYSHRIENLKSWGITTLQLIGYISLAIMGLLIANKLGLGKCLSTKLCVNILCCKIKRNQHGTQSNTIQTPSTTIATAPAINIIHQYQNQANQAFHLKMNFRQPSLWNQEEQDSTNPS